MKLIYTHTLRPQLSNSEKGDLEKVTSPKNFVIEISGRSIENPKEVHETKLRRGKINAQVMNVKGS